MADASDKREVLLQNLQDAGCSGEVIAMCLRLAEENKTDKLLRVLSEHRGSLLETVHDCHKEIDCLDYLVYIIEKQRRQMFGSHTGLL